MAFNPFDMPGGWGTPANAAPAAPGPKGWAPPAPIPPQLNTILPNAAIDGVTGEVFMNEDGKPWDKDALLLRWESSKLLLEEAKNDEMKFRKMVVAAFSNADKKKGTERIELGNGYELKTVKAITYKVGSKVEGMSNADAVQAALARMRAYAGPDVEPGVAALLAERIVRTSYDLSISEYDKLPKPLKDIVDTVVTTTDGAPKVDIVKPKEVAE